MATSDSSDAGVAIAKFIGVMVLAALVVMAVATVFVTLAGGGAIAGTFNGLWNYFRALGETVSVEQAEA